MGTNVLERPYSNAYHPANAHYFYFIYTRQQREEREITTLFQRPSLSWRACTSCQNLIARQRLCARHGRNAFAGERGRETSFHVLTCIPFPSWVLASPARTECVWEDSWINIFPNREAHRNFEVFIKELIMRGKLFENHIKKYLSKCFNNLTLKSQDYTEIERAHFSLAHCPWRITCALTAMRASF